MEQLAASLVGNVRRESVDGRAYLVAPVSMIVPGVLNGSKGALMYPVDEVQKNPGVWNNVPITNGHPYGTNNEAISARDPKTLERFQIGAVYNDRFENGKRVADGWFDEALTRKKAPEVYAALNAGTPMEVSTGLFTDDEPAQNGANYGGTPYQFIAKNYRPDHLAVLPNQRGACSNQDGCGLNVNAAPNQPKSQNTGKFKAMNAGTGKGETHQSAQDGWHGGPRPQECGCPPGVACNCNVKANAFCSTGEGGGQDNSCSSKDGGDRQAAKEYGEALGKAYDQMKDLESKFPVGAKFKNLQGRTVKVHSVTPFTVRVWDQGRIEEVHRTKLFDMKGSRVVKNQSKHKRGPKMNREQGVQWLVTNCECHKGKERVLANADNYSDDEISALVENEQRAQTNQLVVNKFIEAVPGVQSVTLNEIPAFVKGKMKADGSEEDGEAPETDEEEMTEEEKPVGNAKKPMTAEQYIAAMPESLRPVWNEMVANSESQRAELVAEVTKIVKNERDPQRRAIVENKLKGKLTNGELKELIALIKPTTNSTRREPAPAPSPAPSYFGMQGGPAAQANNAALPADELVLDIPTINFADMASPSYKKR